MNLCRLGKLILLVSQRRELLNAMLPCEAAAEIKIGNDDNSAVP